MRKPFLFFLFFVFALVGCATQLDTSQPPEIYYGEDVCTQCNMIINEPRFAASYYTTAGDTRIFGDIGDMCVYHNKHQEDVANFWVHDYETESWVSAPEAFFVVNTDLPTPMGHGVIAFDTQDRAQAFTANQGGEILSFEDVLARFTEIRSSDHNH